MTDKLQSLLSDPSFQSKVSHSTKTYRKNEKIIRQDEVNRYVYLIKSGSVTIAVSGGPKEENKALNSGIADLGPNDLFGEFSLFDDSPASADVIATSDAEIIAIDVKPLLAFLEANPQLGYQVLFDLLQTLIKRLRNSNKTVLRLLEWLLATSS